MPVLNNPMKTFCGCLYIPCSDSFSITSLAPESPGLKTRIRSFCWESSGKHHTWSPDRHTRAERKEFLYFARLICRTCHGFTQRWTSLSSVRRRYDHSACTGLGAVVACLRARAPRRELRHDAVLGARCDAFLEDRRLGGKLLADVVRYRTILIPLNIGSRDLQAGDCALLKSKGRRSAGCHIPCCCYL